MPTMHIGIKSGKPGKAAQHANYIARKGRFSSGDKAADLVYTEAGNMPSGFIDAEHFWQSADLGERKNGAAYREHVLALPRELTRAQQIELARDYVHRQIGPRPFLLVIHCPSAGLEQGQQPHAHVMSSDRIPDGITRDPINHFKRYNPKNPGAGGCRKASGGRSPVEIREQAKRMRQTWADVQNEHLAKAGIAAQVDARSFEERGLQIKPEAHLGPAVIRAMTGEQKQAMAVARSGR